MLTTNIASNIAFADVIIKVDRHNRFDRLVKQESDIKDIASKVEQNLINITLTYINRNASTRHIDLLLNNSI